MILFSNLREYEAKQNKDDRSRWSDDAVRPENCPGDKSLESIA